MEKLKQGTFELKLVAGKYYYPVQCTVHGKGIRLKFGFNRDLLNIIKTQFEGRKWLGINDGPKLWEIPITARNLFRLQALMGKYADLNPYARYDAVDKTSFRDAIRQYCEQRGIKIYSHQVDLINQWLVARSVVWAAEMGTGKTLAAIIGMEMIASRFPKAREPGGSFWIGPKSALVATELEFAKWQCSVTPEFMTYEKLRDVVERWPQGKPAPVILVGDEASKIKTPTSKRSIAFKHLADSMRVDHGAECFITQLSGTPAPKSPADWWHLCEVACPGFLKEGHISHFTERLAVMEQRETVPGSGTYNHIVTWRDSDNKCSVCGQPKEHANHDAMAKMRGEQVTYQTHDFKACVNEVANLKKRMNGLVLVKLKQDCLDLPEKRYERIRVKPSRTVLNAAKIITRTTSRAVEALTRLRTLSDGFQYIDKPTGKFVSCDCDNGTVLEYYNPINEDYDLDSQDVANGFVLNESNERIEIKQRPVTCNVCKGKGEIEETVRTVEEVECPKDAALINQLELHEEAGRLNIYAGFTGSIDRISRICTANKWGYIRVDGRGWHGRDMMGNPLGGKSADLMRIYTQDLDTHPRMAFIGQPGAAGMGLTLTVAPTTVFFSNDFNGENRQQAEARGHRIGMDVERGGLIVDLIHLPSDEKVLENLLRKQELQYMSMTGLAKIFEVERE